MSKSLIKEENGWSPSLSKYDPGLTAKDYHDLFLDERIVKRNWLQSLYEMYQMPGHFATCTQLGQRYGYKPTHYISHFSNGAAASIAKATGCAESLKNEENSRFWPVLFVGKEPEDKSEGLYYWKMRKPVVEAMEMLIDEGILPIGEIQVNTQFDHNMILYGPPGTGKTYCSVIYAVAICEGKSVEDVRKETYRDVLARYRNLKDAGRIAFTTFHQSYGYEEFIEGIKPKLGSESGTLGYSIEDGVFKAFCKRAKESGRGNRPYVFIIDEINRGNISKIFGELITLIEDTKRIGSTEAMEAVLPYSGEAFSVPQNVYILGTMNTADRSIALMDTALRRRFSFVEMMPDSEVLRSLGVGTIEADDETLDVVGMLEVINERIEYLFDREHTIGHAFFTKLVEDASLETLALIFEKSIIPLLQEYFYEDYEKIRLVLGDNGKEEEYQFILAESRKLSDVFMGNPEIDIPEKSYRVQPEAFRKLQSYKKIGKGL